LIGLWIAKYVGTFQVKRQLYFLPLVLARYNKGSYLVYPPCYTHFLYSLYIPTDSTLRAKHCGTLTIVPLKDAPIKWGLKPHTRVLMISCCAEGTWFHRIHCPLRRSNARSVTIARLQRVAVALRAPLFHSISTSICPTRKLYLTFFIPCYERCTLDFRATGFVHSISMASPLAVVFVGTYWHSMTLLSRRDEKLPSCYAAEDDDVSSLQPVPFLAFGRY